MFFLKEKRNLFLKYKSKYKELLRYFFLWQKKWNLYVFKKNLNNNLMLRHFFFFTNDVNFNKILKLMKKNIRNRLKIYKLIYISYGILHKLNFEKKIEVKRTFNKRWVNLNYILNKLHLYVLRRKNILNSIKKIWKDIKIYLNYKWFRVLYNKKFLFVRTNNFNRLYLLKFLKKEKKKREKLKKKRLKSCLMILKKNNNNFFVILSTFGGKILTYKWVGQFNIGHNIKNKRSYYLIYPLMKYIFEVLKKYKINNLVIKIKSNITPHMRKILQLIQGRKIKVSKIYFRKPIPHHLGRRKKKIRRI